ncbi:hypothetical protein [Pusillimonas sp.]|uniref:hypothetical protein n=1 Tax=Pusillimonas sp. TaxID=3040095 RepID=UPI0037CC7BFB
MRRLLWAAFLAFLGALLITSLYRPVALEDQLVSLQVEQAMPEYAPALSTEPAALQALFLAYVDDPILLAKARLALLRYPEIARPIFLLYGDDETFQEGLRNYGEDVVLPIHYFQVNEVFTLELMQKLSDTARSAFLAVRDMWHGNESSGNQGAAPLSPEDRGRYAIHFIQEEGYDFLGQFVMAPNGQVAWVQTERVLEGINRFFAGGIRGLETKLRLEESIGVGDVGGAALDVVIGVSAFKILRMGAAASGGRTLTFSQRSAALGAGLWRGSVIGMRIVKYGAPAVLVYMAVRHPSVINSLLGSAAEKLGVPVAVVQLVGWTLILLPILLVLRILIGPLAWFLAGVVAMLRWGERTLKSRPGHHL